MTTAIWQPHGQAASQLDQFQNYIKKSQKSSGLGSFSELHRWSISHPQEFWLSLAQFLDIDWIEPPEESLILNTESPFLNSQWFPGARLNYCQNLLQRSQHLPNAIVSYHEDQQSPRHFTGAELRKEVEDLASALSAMGLGPGDRVAAVLSNDSAAIVACLATTYLGGVWSSASPDFGTRALLERFSQVQPKIIFWCGRHSYRGQTFHNSKTMEQVCSQLASLEHCIVLDPIDPIVVPGVAMHRWDQLSYGAPPKFASCGFNDPLFIVFSSGTTGKPKAMVHCIGGTLLQHLKEHRLHCDLQQGDRLFFYTTCGWMMWQWQLSALASSTEIITFDGAANFPNNDRLWAIARESPATVLGISPGYIQTSLPCSQRARSFPHLRALLSTGAPLSEYGFQLICQHIKEPLPIWSMSGGTDLLSCFALGNPQTPVFSGQISAPGLGMAIDVWDDEGNPCSIGETGELVCTQPFVSQPRGFLNDPDGERYYNAYFTYFPQRQVWRHGDFVEKTVEGGYVFHGRSDATLNPGGVRIGTAEIYNALQSLPAIEDAVVVDLSQADRNCLALFVKCTARVDKNLEQQIRKLLRDQLSPRHVPQIIYGVKGIPYTKSGKKVELAIKRILENQKEQGLEALQNPEVLSEYRDIRLKLLGNN